MNLDRLPVLTASIADAISSAGARFNRMDRRKQCAVLITAGTVAVTTMLAGGIVPASADAGRPGAPGDSGEVDFRVFPPAGFKATMHSRTAITTGGGIGGWKVSEVMQIDVLSVEADRATFKYRTSSDSSFWGAVMMNPDADHSKNRLCIQTVGRTGNVLHSEGESPDTFSGDSWPDHPVKIGESWSATGDGQGANAGQQVNVTVTLREVATIRGRQMAILEFRTSGSLSGTGTSWVDLETGLTAKTTGSGSGRDAAGIPCTSTSASWLVDASGNRWVD